MKGIDSKIIEFGNGSTGKTNKKINLSLQIGTYEEIFRECSIDVPEYDIVLGLDLHWRNQPVINLEDLSMVIQDRMKKL